MLLLYDSQLCLGSEDQLCTPRPPFEVLDHPKVKYIAKALKLTGLWPITSHNVISIPILVHIAQSCEALDSGQVYRTAFLLGSFAFIRLSNLVPHDLALIDETRHLTCQDIIFTREYAKVVQNHPDKG